MKQVPLPVSQTRKQHLHSDESEKSTTHSQGRYNKIIYKTIVILFKWFNLNKSGVHF